MKGCTNAPPATQRFFRRAGARGTSGAPTRPHRWRGLRPGRARSRASSPGRALLASPGRSVPHAMRRGACRRPPLRPRPPGGRARPTRRARPRRRARRAGAVGPGSAGLRRRRSCRPRRGRRGAPNGRGRGPRGPPLDARAREWTQNPCRRPRGRRGDPPARRGANEKALGALGRRLPAVACSG